MMKYPLMSDNVTREDLDLVIEHLKKDNPKLTNGPECRAFEEDRKSTCLNSSHVKRSRMPSSA